MDHWALGVCLFEFLHGYPPFHDVDVDHIFENITRLRYAIPGNNGENDIDEGRMRDLPSWASLVDGLLRADPHRRMTFSDISLHPFTQTYFTANSTCTPMTPPFVPVIESEDDTRYFSNDTLAAHLDRELPLMNDGEARCYYTSIENLSDVNMRVAELASHQCDDVTIAQ